VLGDAIVTLRVLFKSQGPKGANVLVAFAASCALSCSASNAADSGSADAGDAPDSALMDTGAADAGPSTLRVLFIGNSYTYVNDLPGMLSKIAATAGSPPTITTDEVVQGGATLEDHWGNGVAQAKIAQGNFTHVVLQGQSLEPLTSLAGPQATFFDYARRFGDLSVKAGAQPTLFVTWARAAGDPIYGPGGAFVSPQQMQDELTIAYASVAKLWPRSILACAGEAFRRSTTQYPGIVLQQSDLSHPTVAGTYLAASTFYVALTGQPVPAQSEVPAALSAPDAARLREVAQVGSDCANTPPTKGAILSDVADVAHGGPPLDFGTTALPISNQIQLRNAGGAAVGIRDAMSLAPPFVWTAGGAYPGGWGAGFCPSSLAPGASCLLSITYTGQSSASGQLTLSFTDAYLPSATWALKGTTTQRALLSVSDMPGFYGCTDTCGPSSVGANSGATAPLTLFVMNRGALPVTAFGEGTLLSPPFAWGGGAFPGGVGSVIVGSPGAVFPYCSAAALGVGEECVVTVTFSPPGVGTYTSAVNLTYSDASGPILPNANRNLQGQCSNLPP